MKKIIFSNIFILIFAFQSIGQINPITDLTWSSYYNMGLYDFSLQWSEPVTPHDNIIGYNIYRNNDLYRFQTQNYLISAPAANPNCGQDFMIYGYQLGFYIHVVAVYSPGQIESNYTQTLFVENNLLKNNSFDKQITKIYPNPTKGIIIVGDENWNKIEVYDTLGKKIKEVEPKVQIDLSDISKGLYLIKLISNDRILVDKIIIE